MERGKGDRRGREGRGRAVERKERAGKGDSRRKIKLKEAILS
jgi:hypothetical protein